MKITNLSNTPLSEITRCFNESFSDYFIQFTVNETYLKNRWAAARVRYDLSFGYFIDGTLRGFIVHGIDEHNGVLSAHNCATGIEPPYRGKGILGEIYEVAIDALKKEGVKKSTLEVISKNKKAIRAYEKAGFQLLPTLLNCFTNSPKINIDTPKNISIKKIDHGDFLFYKQCMDFSPTWELTESAFRVFPENFEYWEIFNEQNKLGYLIYTPSTGLISQFAIHKDYRNNGYGKMLFQHLSKTYNNIRVVNIPETSINTVSFLKSIGMNNHIDQYLMEREI